VLVSISPKVDPGTAAPPRPHWLRAPAPGGENYRDLKELIGRLRLHTVAKARLAPTWENAGTTGPPPS